MIIQATFDQKLSHLYNKKYIVSGFIRLRQEVARRSINETTFEEAIAAVPSRLELEIEFSLDRASQSVPESETKAYAEQLIFCLKRQFGLTLGLGAAGTTAVILGQPILDKPRIGIAGGGRAGNKTSVASKFFRKVIGRRHFSIFATRRLGAIAGRTVPYVGWGLLAADAIQITHCLHSSLNSAKDELCVY